MRPRCCLRYLTFFGINIELDPCRSRFRVPGSQFVFRFASGFGSLRSRRAARRPIPILFVTSGARHQPLALVEPHLHANLAVGRAGFGEAVVDVGAQRLQRQLPVQIPLRPRDFRAVQPSRHAHLDAARAEPQRRFHRLAHRAAEGHALFELHGHRLGDELRLELRLLDLLDVDEDLAARALLDLLLQLVDFRPLAADDDAWTRGVDVDLQVVRRALGLDARDPGVREALLQVLPQGEVLVEQLRVVLVREPARAPGLVEAEAESVRMNLLAHVFSYAFAAAVLRPAVFLVAPAAPPVFRARAGLAASPSCATRAILSGCSATRTVRCAVRFTTRNARPIGAGRTRFIDVPWFAKHACTNSRSTSPPKPSFCCALATAERSTFAISRAMIFRVNCSVARAWLTPLPRIRSITRPAFWADVRTPFAVASA